MIDLIRVLCFFFSSRRRHTRYIGDWSSDVCSSDLVRQQLFKGNEYWFWLGTEVDRAKISVHVYDSDGKLAEEPDSWEKEIGRASCRERVWIRVGGGWLIIK